MAISNTCFYCGHISQHVECQGMWYCPNLVCNGPGAGWFRSKLPSYKETGGVNGSHTVDFDEWHRFALEEYKNNPDREYVILLK